MAINRLPSDIWLLIFEKLDIGDLDLLSRSFEWSSINWDIPSMAESRAINAIYERLILDVQIPQVVVTSDKSLREQCLVTPGAVEQRTKCLPIHISRPYLADNADFAPTFSPTSSSALKMTLQSTTKYFGSFCPGNHDGEPLEPIHTQIRLPTSLSREAPFVELDYCPVDKSAHTVDDVHHHERFISRTIRQTLMLKSASWVWIEFISARSRWSEIPRPTPIRKERALPLEWFSSLGLGEVHVKATFDKKGSIDSTLEDWIEHESDLQYMSVSFENLKLPTSPSLLKLFPKEVLEGLPA